MEKEEEKRSSSESEDSDGSSSSDESSSSSRGSSASRDTKDNRSDALVLIPSDRLGLEGKASNTRKRSRSKSADCDARSKGGDRLGLSNRSAAERISPPRSRRRSRSPRPSSVEKVTKDHFAGSSVDPKVHQRKLSVSPDKKAATPISDKEKSRSRSPRVRNRGSLSGGYQRRRRRSSSPRKSSSSPRKRSRSKSRSRSRSNSRIRNQRRRYRSRSPPNRERHNLRLNSSYRYQRSDFRGRGQGARRFYNRNSYSRPYRYQGLPYNRRRRSRSGSYPRDAHGFKSSSRRTRSPSRSPDRRNRRSGSRADPQKSENDRRLSSVPREGSPLSSPLGNVHKKVPETRKHEIDSDSDSTSSSDSSSSGGKKKKKRSKKVKKEKHKKKSKKGKHSKKKRKSSKSSRKDRKSKRSSLENINLAQHSDTNTQLSKTVGNVRPVEEARKFAPKSQAEWEKEQSVVRKELDEQTGRVRLVRGTGEIIESIVSKQQHREINRAATKQDGDQFQVQLNKKLK